jgi:hypothetical protein
LCLLEKVSIYGQIVKNVSKEKLLESNYLTSDV